MRRFLPALCGLALMWSLCGCGYTTRGYVTQAGYKTIYVEPFTNSIDTTSEYAEGSRFRTYFPLLENTITNAVVDRFNFDGSLKTSRQEDADLVLSGSLVNYRRDSLRTSSDDNPEEYRVTLFVNIKLVEGKTGKVLWQKNDFAGDATYFVSGGLARTESQAVQEAALDLARRIMETTVEVW
ncbi:MAG: LptE family protein [Candidatus Omnitrophica bacterium]|nr:LptE family protein [Candidatus Omnitrophota bacterium]MDD5574267.1 LptE family protein [Candidatus Omnitrophota bacterium]